MRPDRNEYPKRPPFFALKFARLLGKACVANYIGADAAYLLAQIVLVEDAKNYRSPVTFFNEQLMPIVGCKSVDSLARIRGRAVASGWLNYTPGGKSIPGTYWVTIPEEFGRMDDGPVDENPSEYAPDSSAKMRREPGDKTVYYRKNAEESQKEVRKEPREKPEESAEHSSLTKKPIPDPREDSPEPPKPAASVPATIEPAILVFPTVGNGPKEWSLVHSQISKWRQVYPALDVLAECRKALAWIEANTARRKTAKGMCAFLVNWLNRATNNGGSARASGGYRSRAQVQDDYLLEQFASIANTTEVPNVG